MNFFKTLYLLPGKLILWWLYMNPEGGFADVVESSRRYRSGAYTMLVSTGFWALAGYLYINDWKLL